MVKLLFTAWIAFFLGGLTTLLGIMRCETKVQIKEEEEIDEEREILDKALENALKEELKRERETKRLSK